MQRHLFWSNKKIEAKNFENSGIRYKNKISDFENFEIVKNSKIKNKRQALRNQIEPELGLYIFEQITGEKNDNYIVF